MLMEICIAYPPLNDKNDYPKNTDVPHSKNSTVVCMGGGLGGIMARKTLKQLEKERNDNLQKEKKRLAKIFKKIPKDSYNVAKNLIENVAFMSIILDELMQEISKSKFVVKTKNGSQTFSKESPLLTTYNKMYANFQKGIQALISLVPQSSQPDLKEDDEFMEFMRNKNAKV